MEHFRVSELVSCDYDSGYLELMQDFSNYTKEVSRESFEQYLANSVDRRIMVLRNTDQKIIGAGTIFKIEKLHNNAIGQIEDVMVAEQYRGKGLGKLIVRHLTQIGLDDFAVDGEAHIIAGKQYDSNEKSPLYNRQNKFQT